MPHLNLLIIAVLAQAVGAQLLSISNAGKVAAATAQAPETDKKTGKLAVEAVQTRDRELVLSVTLISGLLTLFGYLLADIAYAIVDPRVSYD